MSLRHILNDEPPPNHSRQPYAASSRTASGDHLGYSEDPQLSPSTASPPRSYSSQRLSRESHSARPYYHPPNQYDPGWDSRSGEYSPDDHASYASEGRRAPFEQDHVVSPVETPSTTYLQEEERDVIAKKRRKGGDLDAEYVPSKPRRVRVFLLVQISLSHSQVDESAKVDAER